MTKSISPRIKIIISMIIWGTIGIFVREIDLTSIEVAFFRAFIGSLFLILISLVKKEKIDKEILKIYNESGFKKEQEAKNFITSLAGKKATITELKKSKQSSFIKGGNI